MLCRKHFQEGSAEPQIRSATLGGRDFNQLSWCLFDGTKEVLWGLVGWERKMLCRMQFRAIRFPISDPSYFPDSHAR